MAKNWKRYLDKFGNELLNQINGWGTFNEGLTNPVSEALKDPDFMKK